MASVNDYFSVVAFFILFRESAEGSVIVAILLQCMDRILPRLKRQVWVGALVGAVCAILLGGVFIAVWYTLRRELYSDTTTNVFDIVMSTLAWTIITWFTFTMLTFSNIEAKLKRRLEKLALKAAADVAREREEIAAEMAAQAQADASAMVIDAPVKDVEAARIELEERTANRLSAMEKAHHKKQAYGVSVISFVSVFREAVEGIIFVFGVGGGVTISAIPLAAFAGILAGVAVGVFIYYTGHAVKQLKWFFIAASVLLFFIAAGQVGYFMQAVVELYQAKNPDAEPAWWNTPVWDISSCCGEDDGFWSLMHEVFGYTDAPTPLWIIGYCGYWVFAISLMVFKWRRGTLLDRDGAYRRRFRAMGIEEGAEMEDMIDAARKADKAKRRAFRRALITCKLGQWRREQHLKDAEAAKINALSPTEAPVVLALEAGPGAISAKKLGGQHSDAEDSATSLQDHVGTGKDGELERDDNAAANRL